MMVQKGPDRNRPKLQIQIHWRLEDRWQIASMHMDTDVEELLQIEPRSFNGEARQL